MKVASKNIASVATSTRALGGAHETNLHMVHADHCREEYASLYTLLKRMEQACIEGVTELTLRTRTKTVVVPLTGQLGEELGAQLKFSLADMMGVKLDKLETDIFKYAEGSLEEKETTEEGECIDPRAAGLAFCLPMRRLSDEEFLALPAEARRQYDSVRAEQVQAA